ncbi:nucleotide-binding domain-containing protein [Robertmurraya siralis]|uniref:nucleotide-binding domain-containing protein n=1 Tax=Robertmurraya siralis TaxID=77777 RepID=UPI00357095E2
MKKFLNLLQQKAQYPLANVLDVRYELYNQTKSTKLTYRTNRKNERLSPKRCSLLFEAVHNVPAPYEIVWKVNNKSDEEQDINDLGHSTKYQYYEGSFHWEGTVYKGIHSMTVRIVKNRNVVAKKEVLVTII